MNKQQVLVKWALPYREHPVSSHSFFPHPCLNFFLQQRSSIKGWHIRSLLATGRGSVPFRELLLISSLVSTFMTELTSKAKPWLLFPKDWSVLDVRIHTNVVLPVSDRNSVLSLRQQWLLKSPTVLCVLGGPASWQETWPPGGPGCKYRCCCWAGWCALWGGGCTVLCWCVCVPVWACVWEHQRWYR